jgi:hypothetical protein
MRGREFDINIAADGSVELHVQGIKGRSCLEIVRLFEKVVGELQSQGQTSEFLEPEDHLEYRVDQRI